MSVFRRFTNRRKSNQPTNGYSTGTSSSVVNAPSKQVNGSNSINKKSAQQTTEDASAAQDPTVTRETVSETFVEYAQLIHASQRPLPNQSGDGQYLEKDEPSGFWADMKSLGIKGMDLLRYEEQMLTLYADLKTVRHILEDKANGLPQDDRKMHMEEIMQVCNTQASTRNGPLIHAASRSSSYEEQDAC
jgi:linoleate 10R-lipoxygenase